MGFFPLSPFQIHFPKYIEPLSNGEATIDDSQKLWRNIQPVLRDSIQSLYLREVKPSFVLTKIVSPGFAKAFANAPLYVHSSTFWALPGRVRLDLSGFL